MMTQKLKSIKYVHTCDDGLMGTVQFEIEKTDKNPKLDMDFYVVVLSTVHVSDYKNCIKTRHYVYKSSVDQTRVKRTTGMKDGRLVSYAWLVPFEAIFPMSKHVQICALDKDGYETFKTYLKDNATWVARHKAWFIEKIPLSISARYHLVIE